MKDINTIISFDKLKLITPISNLVEIDYNYFNTITRNDSILYYKYQQTKPFQLLVIADYYKDELILEFSGKILLNNFKSLINKYTIRECIENINKLGVCELNVDSLLNNATVAKCDVTRDVEADVKVISSTIKQNLDNYAKWNTEPYLNGIVLKNVVSTPKYKKRLVIYDKYKELNQGISKQFLDSLSDRNEILNYYTNKVRFELNINTMYQMRQLLNIPDNQLQTVLNSIANPILSVIDEGVKFEPHRKKEMTLRDYERMLLIKDCSYDMAKVEANVRAYTKKTCSIRNAMKPYKQLFKQINNEKYEAIDLRALVS